MHLLSQAKVTYIEKKTKLKNSKLIYGSYRVYRAKHICSTCKCDEVCVLSF